MPVRDFSYSDMSIAKKTFTLLVIFLCVSVLFTQTAFATDTPVNSNTLGITNALCAVINQITGPIGKGIATIILISLAISMFLGKLSWGVALAFIVAIGMLFGATSVINMISSNNDAVCGS